MLNGQCRLGSGHIHQVDNIVQSLFDKSVDLVESHVCIDYHQIVTGVVSTICHSPIPFQLGRQGCGLFILEV